MYILERLILTFLLLTVTFLVLYTIRELESPWRDDVGTWLYLMIWVTSLLTAGMTLGYIWLR